MKNKRKKELIFEIVKRIKIAYSPKKIILFGSYAYGNPTKDSDIDLLIIKNTNEKIIDRIVHIYKIIGTIQNDEIKFIDLAPFVITPKELKQRLEMGDHFFKEIISKGKVLYGK